ncbi:8.6 kDa transglutaminase substrate-like [Penaeus japonicus]|uniref:8.6 kDa transglutaminase substrate-like n=1 Tax=Penaeus japonicus TaxID=27405 RepID=UPI001C70F73F|nr:8.6 kDa transglutaminase substrate-like [Penaeus japonicus]
MLLFVLFYMIQNRVTLHFSSLSESGFFYQCETCNSETCPKIDPTSCEHGLTLDICHCCQMCGRGLNEPCEPLQDCGEGLYCKPNNPSWGDGVCKPKGD